MLILIWGLGPRPYNIYWEHTQYEYELLHMCTIVTHAFVFCVTLVFCFHDYSTEEIQRAISRVHPVSYSQKIVSHESPSLTLAALYWYSGY